MIKRNKFIDKNPKLKEIVNEDKYEIIGVVYYPKGVYEVFYKKYPIDEIQIIEGSKSHTEKLFGGKEKIKQFLTN